MEVDKNNDPPDPPPLSPDFEGFTENDLRRPFPSKHMSVVPETTFKDVSRFTRKRPRPSSIQTTAPGITTSNSFSSLQEDEVVTTTQKNYKPPPIVVPKKSSADIEQILRGKNLKYTMRNTSVGVKINFINQKDYDDVQNILNDADYGFYTHSARKDQHNKFILFGLHKIPSQELAKYLEEFNVVPAEIKLLTSKKLRWVNETLYMLSFPKDGPKLSDLRKISSIAYVMVKWDVAKRLKRGPTQCRNCQIWGHGSSHCHLPARCVHCAEHHSSEDCNGANKPAFVNICCNCGQKHPADFVECSGRNKYIEFRNRTNHKALQAQRPHHPQGPKWSIAPQPQPLSASFANVAQHGSPANKTSPPINASVNNDQMPSGAEILAIVTDIFQSTRSCRTRAELMQTIFTLTLKYVFP